MISEVVTNFADFVLFSWLEICGNYVMRETQEDYYLVLFTFASQLYFYVLGPISLLGY